MSDVAGLQEGVEAVKVTIEGLEMFLRTSGKMIDWSFEKLVLIGSLLFKMHEKKKSELLKGEVNISEIIKKDSKGVGIFQIKNEEREAFFEYAKKLGLSYSVMPDINKQDEYCEIAFGESQGDLVRYFIAQNPLAAKTYSFSEYIDNSDPVEQAAIMNSLGEDAKKAAIENAKMLKEAGMENDVINNISNSDEFEEIVNSKDPYVFEIDKEYLLKHPSNDSRVFLAIPNRDNEYINIPISRLSFKENKVIFAMREDDDFDVYDKDGSPVMKDNRVIIITADDYYKRCKNVDIQNIKNTQKRNEIKNKTVFKIKSPDGNTHKKIIEKAKEDIEIVKKTVKPKSKI